MVVVVNKASFDAEVMKYDKAVVIDFYADWCGPCKMISPILEELSKEWKDVKFVKLDTEADPEIAMKFNVMSIPTLIVMRQGREAGRVVGYMTKASLKEKLLSLVA